MRILFDNKLFDSQFLRTIGHTYYGGADMGECFETAMRIKKNDVDSWYIQWKQVGDRIFSQAAQYLQEGHRISARGAYLRASNYYRNAYIFLMKSPIDARLLEAFELQALAFKKAAMLFEYPFEPIKIPYEDTTLPGYFCTVDKSGVPRPLVILTGGYDSTLEELYFFNGAAALQRGYNCLFFDGPGQGSMLIKQQRYFRPDWENVIKPVIDFALKRKEVNANQLCLIGLSFGGYLASRAAVYEKRLAACIADPGHPSLLKVIKSKLPFPSKIKDALPDQPWWAVRILGMLMGQIAKLPLRGWALRRCMLAHGTSSPLEYFKISRLYTIENIAHEIECPMFICGAENDQLAKFSKDLYYRLTCPQKCYVQFTSSEGAGEHCENGNRSIFHERAFNWLDSLLKSR